MVIWRMLIFRALGCLNPTVDPPSPHVLAVPLHRRRNHDTQAGWPEPVSFNYQLSIVNHQLVWRQSFLMIKYQLYNFYNFLSWPITATDHYFFPNKPMCPHLSNPLLIGGRRIFCESLLIGGGCL